MSAWETVKLGDLIKINPESMKKDYPYQTIEYIDISSVGSGVLHGTTPTLLKDAPSRAKRLVKDKDTILSTVRPNRRSFWFIKKPLKNLVVSTGFAVLRATERIDPRYLFYVISDKRFTDYLVANEKGAAYPAVGVDTIANAEISIPSYFEQEIISTILGALDDKIELNLKMNETLEQMAMTLYKHWFIDFGPFQDGDFTETELGGIPKGWKVMGLKDIANILMGQSPKSEFYNQKGDGLPFHQGVANFGIRFPTNVTYSTKLLRVAEEGDFLISVRAPVGRLNVAHTKMVIGRGLSAISSKTNNPSFLFYTLKTIFSEEDKYGSGTIFNSINKGDLENLKVIVPLETIINEYESKVSRYDSLIKRNYEQILLLIDTRDYLLPRLLSGEIDVFEAAEIVRGVISNEQPEPSI